MQKLSFKIEGFIKTRSQDEQAILAEGLMFEEFPPLEDDLDEITNVDLPAIDLGA